MGSESQSRKLVSLVDLEVGKRRLGVEQRMNLLRSVLFSWHPTTWRAEYAQGLEMEGQTTSTMQSGQQWHGMVGRSS